MAADDLRMEVIGRFSFFGPEREACFPMRSIISVAIRDRDRELLEAGAQLSDLRLSTYVRSAALERARRDLLKNTNDQREGDPG